MKEPHFSESITLEILKAWRWSFFSKWSKYYVHFKNAIITAETVFGFEDKCFGICFRNFCLLWQEYMSSAVNMLKYGPNIWDPTKRHDTQLTLFDINGKFAWKGCSETGSFFGINNSGNNEGIKVVLFVKMLKILCRFEKCYDNSRKLF